MYVTLKSPTGVTKRDFAIFSSKFQLRSQKSLLQSFFVWKLPAAKCSYIIALSNGPQMDCGRCPHLPNICTQSDPPPSQNADFDRFCLIVPQPWELVRIAIIANRKSTTRFPASHRWTLCVTPKSPKRWLKTRIFTFGITFHFFVAGHRRHFKFGMWVEHSKSQPTDDKLSLKGAWSLSRDLFNFWKISDNI